MFIKICNKTNKRYQQHDFLLYIVLFLAARCLNSKVITIRISLFKEKKQSYFLQNVFINLKGVYINFVHLNLIYYKE